MAPQANLPLAGAGIHMGASSNQATLLPIQLPAYVEDGFEALGLCSHVGNPEEGPFQ